MPLDSHPDLRPGSTQELHAIVLGSVTWQETNKIVSLLTLDHGKISAIAPSAARSLKRFGAALDVASYIKAHVRVPRSESLHSQAGGAPPLWQLNRADLRDSFLHLRSSYARLECAFFAVRLIKDLIPEGPVDPLLFQALGRFLRDSEFGNLDQSARWARAAFWTWLAHHLGFGDLSQDLEKKMVERDPRFVELWHATLAQDLPQFAQLFTYFASQTLPTLQMTDEIALYQKWVDLSSLHWEHFEEWLQLKKSS